MNPATTTVKVETTTNTMVFGEPFVLFLGRKGRLVEEPARLEVSQQYETLHDDDDPFGPVSPSRLVSEKASLFISDEPYATVKIRPRRKYGRRLVKIVKPDNGPMEVHLTKRYVMLSR